MPEFAEINTQTNEVLRVVGAKSKLWCEYELDGTWVNAHYDTPGKNYAGIGFVYHPDKENFSAPQPYPSWTLDDQCIWQPPVPYPSGDKMYTWNEETQSWDEDDILT
jgi:hypothetical protein